MQQKNVSIEAFRFIFMVILCLWHIEGMIHIQNHGYLVVEFFFILSGALIYKSFLSHPEMGSLDFTIKKIKRFSIEYLIAMIPTFLLYNRGTMATLDETSIMPFILKLFSEAMQLHRIGIYPDASNGPTWYLSVLIFAGGFIYSLLKFNHKLTLSLLLPLSCVLVYSYIFAQGKQTSIEHWECIGPFLIPLWRGFAGIGLGVITLYVFQKKTESFRSYKTLLNVLSIISFVFILLLIFCKYQNDAYILIFAPILIFALLFEDSWLNRIFQSKLWAILGGISYEMLLVHMAIRSPLIYYGIYKWMSPCLLTALYLSLVLASSFLLKALGERIRFHLHW